MINKFASLVLVIALVSTLGGSSAFANAPTKPDGDVADVLKETDKNKVQPNEKLSADISVF